jgi:hypothetical protein
MDNYKQPSEADYFREARTGKHGPSAGLRHDAAERDGQTVLAPCGPPNNVGVSSLPIKSSLCDEHFGGGIDFTEIDCLLRDAGGRAPHRPVRVNDEVGHRGTERRSASGFGEEDDTLANAMARGFIRVAGF